jgi:hypothetical protein
MLFGVSADDTWDLRIGPEVAIFFLDDRILHRTRALAVPTLTTESLGLETGYRRAIRMQRLGRTS